MSASLLLKRLDSLKGSEERNNFESLWQAGAEYCNPANSDILTTSSKGQRRSVSRVTDVGIEARRGFATGMYSWAIGDGAFFSFSPSSRELADMEEVIRWFSDVNTITLAELKESNFDAEILQLFGELSYIGTSATFIEWFKGKLNFRTQHISQFWIDVDSRGMVDTVFCEFPLNARQLIGEFGKDNVPDYITSAIASESNEEFLVVQATMENKAYKPNSIIPSERQFTSTYILRKGKEELRVDGYDTFPFSVARLYKAKNEMYGRSCYMEASKTISLNNDQEITIIRGGKNRADPPWIEASDSRTRHIRNNQISKVIYDPTSLGGAPTQSDMKNDVGITEGMLERSESRIQKAFLQDAFNPIEDNRNMTKYETARRIGFGLSKVTPPLNKWQSEYATPSFERIFDILLKKGKFPPMPMVLEGEKFTVDYISKAALALEEMQLNNVQAAIFDAMELAQVEPNIMDNYNLDEAVRIGAKAYNLPNKVVRSSDEVAQIRQQRAEQQQQQQQVDNAPKLADAAFKAEQIGK